MSTEDFVKCFHEEKESLLRDYLNPQTPKVANVTTVSDMLQKLSLREDEMSILRKILNTVITDVMYTILLGLNGSASIGGRQEMYKVLDEEGNELTETGDIEGHAYEYFHGSKSLT